MQNLRVSVVGLACLPQKLFDLRAVPVKIILLAQQPDSYESLTSETDRALVVQMTARRSLYFITNNPGDIQVTLIAEVLS